MSSSIIAYAAACILCPSHTPSFGGFPLLSSTGSIFVSWHSSLSILPFSPSLMLCKEYSVLTFGVIAFHSSSPVSPFSSNGIILFARSSDSNFIIGSAFWNAVVSGMVTSLSAFECSTTIFLSICVYVVCIFSCTLSVFLSSVISFCSSFAMFSWSLCFMSPSIITSFGGSSMHSTYDR